MKSMLLLVISILICTRYKFDNDLHIIGSFLSWLMILFDFWCLTPLSAIFQLYHGDQF